MHEENGVKKTRLVGGKQGKKKSCTSVLMVL